jgi:hypothetical protein
LRWVTQRYSRHSTGAISNQSSAGKNFVRKRQRQIPQQINFLIA